MAALPTQKNPLTILRNFRTEIQRRTSITNFDRDSKTRALTDTFVDEQLEVREELVTAFQANQLDNAQGPDLDRIGESLGLPRRLASFAEVSDIELSLTFFVQTGDFGSINGGAPITIPAGSGILISSSPNNNESGAQIDYELTESITLPALESLGFASARAVISGSRHNVGTFVLTQHNFTDYVDSASNSLQVTNRYPILTGREEELDNTYRFRISQRYNSLLQVNSSKILLTGLQVPGVTNAIANSGYFGIGSVGIIVKGPEGQANARLVGGVQQQIESFRAPGMRMNAILPTEVAFDIELEVQLAKKISTAEQNTLRRSINRIALDYFRRQSTGSDVDLRDLAANIQQSTNGLVSLKRKGLADMFKKVYVRIGQSSSNQGERDKLISPIYSLESDELAILGALVIAFI